MSRYYKLKEGTEKFNENRMYFEHIQEYMRFKIDIISEYIGGVSKDDKSKILIGDDKIFGVDVEFVSKMDEKLVEKLFKKRVKYMSNLKYREFKKTQKLKKVIEKIQNHEYYELISGNRNRFMFIAFSGYRIIRRENLVLIEIQEDCSVSNEWKDLLEEITMVEYAKLKEEDNG